MTEITATIEKSQISELGKLKGSANAAKISIAGEDYDPGHLQFCGFAGTRGADNRYHGVFRFESCIGGSCPVVPFDFLKQPKPQAPPQETKQEPKQSKGKVSNDSK